MLCVILGSRSVKAQDNFRPDSRSSRIKVYSVSVILQLLLDIILYSKTKLFKFYDNDSIVSGLEYFYFYGSGCQFIRVTDVA